MSDSTANDTLLTKLRKFIWYSLLRVPWLIAYNVGGAAVLVAFFALTSQGQDLLRLAAERGFGLGGLGLLWNLLLLFSTLLTSVAFWYVSRLMLARDYPGYPLERPYADLGRRWWPRLTGIAVPLAIAWSFRKIGSEVPSSETLLSWLYLGMAVLLLAYYLLRRLLFGIPRDYMIGALLEDLPPQDKRRARALLAGAFALLLLFTVLPVHLPQWLGAPAIAVLGVLGIALFGSAVLTYVPMSRGAPAATLTALLLALLFGLWNQNHPIRLADADVAGTERRTPAQQLADWRQRRGVAADDEPTVFVTAAGGGIRAAYWTASALAYLEQTLGPAFSDRLFAISGVSGGSVGAAVHVTLKRAQLVAAQSASQLEAARKILGHDFLSPVVAGMLFPDLAQRFFPFPVTLADRQRFLERAWEDAFAGDARALFKGPFQGLYAEPAGARLPSLLLNTTVVETGQRAVFSNLKVGGLPDVLDMLDDRYQLAEVRTSAAAGASARFTYVSPAGRVDIANHDSIRLVDGGYFENSGAATMGDLIALLGDSGQSFRPILVMIRNDPTAARLCRRDGGGGSAPNGGQFNATISEITAPAEALLETRGARQRIAEVKAARLVEAMGGSVIEIPLAAVLDVQIATLKTASAEPVDEETIDRLRSRYLEPPLGWSLSEEVRKGMDETMDNELGGLAQQFRYLETALQGGSVPPCDPM